MIGSENWRTEMPDLLFRWPKIGVPLLCILSPPNHRDGVIHHTRKQAEADSEHFDGKTTEK